MSQETEVGGVQQELRQLLSPDKLDRLADEILTDKDKTLEEWGFDPEYSDWSGTEELTEKVKQDLERQLKYLESQPVSIETVVKKINRDLVILAEVKLLGQKGISHSRQLRETKPDLRIGIQKEQMKTILALESMNSPEVPSGQGKTVPCVPVAAVARRLITQKQVHLMSLNPTLKQEDGERLAKFAQEVGLENVCFIEDEEKEFSEGNKRLKELLLAEVALEHTQLEDEEKRALLDKIGEETAKIINQMELRKVKRDRGPKLVLASGDSKKKVSLEQAEMVVGTDYDFLFSFLRNNTSPPWEKGKSSLIIDEEVPVRRPSPYIIEEPTGKTIAEFLQNWLLAGVTQKICRELEAQDFIEKKDTGWFLREDEEKNGWDEFEKRSGEILANPQDAFWPTLTVSLQEKLGQTLQAVASGYGLAFAKDQVQIKSDSLINDYLDFFEWEPFVLDWLNSHELQRGEHYVVEDGKLILRDPATGHALERNRYQGLTQFTLEAREGVCSFEAPTIETQTRASFYSFLEKAYGRGEVAFTSATLTDLAEELAGVTGTQVAEIKRWIGEELKIPPIEVKKDFQEALTTLEGLLKEAQERGQPFCFVCDNDLEVELLVEHFEKKYTHLQKVTTLTSLDEERAIISQAGEVKAITFANPKEGRAIDIKTSDEAEETGGLRLVVWGELKNKAVLLQVLARTKRVGKKGEVHWLVYKQKDPQERGHAALIDKAKENEFLKKEISRLPARTKLKGSVVETMHLTNDGHDRILRVRQYAVDYTLALIRGKIPELLEKSTGISFDKVSTKHCQDVELAQIINFPAIISLAESYLRAVPVTTGLQDMLTFGALVREAVAERFEKEDWQKLLESQTLELAVHPPAKREKAIIKPEKEGENDDFAIHFKRNTFQEDQMSYEVVITRFVRKDSSWLADEQKTCGIILPKGVGSLADYQEGYVFLSHLLRAMELRERINIIEAIKQVEGSWQANWIKITQKTGLPKDEERTQEDLIVEQHSRLSKVGADFSELIKSPAAKGFKTLIWRTIEYEVEPDLLESQRDKMPV